MSEDPEEGIRKRKLNLVDFLKDSPEAPAKRADIIDEEPVRPFGQLGAVYSDEEDEQDEPRARGFQQFQGFQPMSFAPASAQEPEDEPVIRPKEMEIPRANKFKGMKYGIGASLLKKMGYVEGQGLGKHAQGILEPIEQELRRSGAGLGASTNNNKNKNNKNNKNNENIDFTDENSSSDEEPENRQTRSLYDLVWELSQKAPLPPVITSYSDSRGAHSVEHDGTIDEVRAQLSVLNQELDEINAQNALLNHKSAELARLQSRNSSMLSAYEELSTVVDSLAGLFIDSGLDLSVKAAKLRDEITKLESVNKKDSHLDVQKTITIAIKPIVTDLINEWDPLDFSNDTTLEEILLLQNVLPEDENTTDVGELDYFQSLLYSLWYPKVSQALEDWSVEHPNVAITLLLDWTEVLDQSIINYTTSTIIKPKILEAIRNWNPVQIQNNAPFVWIFEYIPYLDDDSMDEIKDEFIKSYTPILENWPQSDTHIEGLRSFKEIIGSESFNKLINKKLIPNLTAYLFNSPKSFTSPNVTIIESFFIWEKIISNHIFNTLLQYAFFEPWKEALYKELSTPNSNFEIISKGFENWVDCLRNHSNHSEIIIVEVYQALGMINKFIDTGELTPVQKSLTIDKILYTALNEDDKPKIKGIPTHKLQVTFKDVVEHYCTGNNLFITPLKNDLSIGHSLFKIVGNNLGKNGLTAYIEDDVLWIKNRTVEKFEPVSLGDLLTRF